MNINENYIKCFQEVSSLLLTQEAPDQLIRQWYNGEREGTHYNLQDFSIDHARIRWNTGIGTIEAVELIISKAVWNDNLKLDLELNTTHKPCTCSCCQGTMYFRETEDFNPGSEPEWSTHPSWSCDTCGEYVTQCDEQFEWPE